MLMKIESERKEHEREVEDLKNKVMSNESMSSDMSRKVF